MGHLWCPRKVASRPYANLQQHRVLIIGSTFLGFSWVSSGGRKVSTIPDAKLSTSPFIESLKPFTLFGSSCLGSSSVFADTQELLGTLGVAAQFCVMGKLPPTLGFGLLVAGLIPPIIGLIPPKGFAASFLLLASKVRAGAGSKPKVENERFFFVGFFGGGLLGALPLVYLLPVLPFRVLGLLTTVFSLFAPPLWSILLKLHQPVSL